MPESPIHAGKLVTLGILLLAMGLAAFAWAYHRGRGQRAMAYWGAANALCIKHAEEVSLASLQRGDASTDEAAGEMRLIDGRPWTLSGERDISGAAGLVHLRQALLEDRSFVWTPAAHADDRQWDHLLRFQGEDRTVEMAISLQDERLKCLGGPPTIGLRIAEGIAIFMNELPRSAAGE